MTNELDRLNYECDKQMSIFDYINTEFKITNPIRLIELFAGVGSQAMALRDIGADFETYRVVEFDKYAIASYNAIHGTNFPTMDVTKIKGSDLGIVDVNTYTYLLTYSFPCTDLSPAGKRAGMAEGSGTRSSLLWEVRRLLDETENLPQVLLMENVPQVHSKANIEHFKTWLNYLESKGYSTYYEDLNAKNYGVAQSRNRTFAISILGNYTYTFPKPFPLTKRMKDYLEPVVDEKYYVKSDKARELIDKLVKEGKIKTEGIHTCDHSIDNANTHDIANTIKARYDEGVTNRQHEGSCVMSVTSIEKFGNLANSKQRKAVYNSDKISPTIQAAAGEGGGQMPYTIESQEINTKFVGSIYGHGQGYAGAVWDSEKVSPTLMTMQGGNREPMITEIVAMRGRDPQNPKDRTPGNPNLEQRLEPNAEGICNTLTTVQKDNMAIEIEPMGVQMFKSKHFGGWSPNFEGCVPTIKANKVDTGVIVTLGNYMPSEYDASRVCDAEGIAPTAKENHGTVTGVVQVKQATKQGYTECELGGVADLTYPDSQTRRGRVIDKGNVSPTITTENTPSVLEPWMWEIDGKQYYIRIRKLTPKECWRLMGFTDEDFEKAQKVNSNTQLYKQAGNSIVKNVLCEIFKKLF